MAIKNVSVDRIAVWECIGCGKIEGPRPCIGICQDRKAEFVHAFEYDEVILKIEIVRRRADALEALVRRLACTTPREGEWERSYRALQEQAHQMLAALTAEPGDRTCYVDSGTDAGSGDDLPVTRSGSPQ